MKNIALFSSAFIIIPAGRDVIFPLTPLPGMDDGKMLQLMNPSGKGKRKKKQIVCVPNQILTHTFFLFSNVLKNRGASDDVGLMGH